MMGLCVLMDLIKLLVGPILGSLTPLSHRTWSTLKGLKNDPIKKSKESLGCDFFERRGEKRIDVGTLLAFLFFLFQMASYVFVIFFVCFFWLWSLQVRVCAYGRIDRTISGT